MQNEKDSSERFSSRPDSSSRPGGDPMSTAEVHPHFLVTVACNPEVLHSGEANEEGDKGEKTITGWRGSRTMEEPPGELNIIGKFQLKEEIARGGMGIIFNSRDMILDREVAIKLLLNAHVGISQLHEQFVNESIITGRLQHPGIVPIYESGIAFGNRPWFAMKLVRGKTLAQLLTDRESPSEDLPRMLKIFEQVCHTLAYTHSCGVVHLDIKPANIMVGAFGEVHLMDWGLARAAAGPTSPAVRWPAATELASLQKVSDPPSLVISSGESGVQLRTGPVCGTPAYMSPEQARSEYVDLRSDVFGLGGILCEILTGSPPYLGNGLIDVLFKAERGELESAHSQLKESGEDDTLVRLALKCLACNPHDRPEDASIVAEEITQYFESVVHRAENDLVRFFELSLDLFCIAGLDGFFRRVNSNFPRVLGYPESELVSRPFIDFVHPDDRDETGAVMSQLCLGQPVVQFRNRYRAADNSWRCLEWTAKSIPEEGIIFAVARDVTNRL